MLVDRWHMKKCMPSSCLMFDIKLYYTCSISFTFDLSNDSSGIWYFFSTVICNSYSSLTCFIHNDSVSVIPFPYQSLTDHFYPSHFLFSLQMEHFSWGEVTSFKGETLKVSIELHWYYSPLHFTNIKFIICEKFTDNLHENQHILHNIKR